MSSHLQSPIGPLDRSLCGKIIFRGRYQYVKQDPSCSVCRRIAAKLPSGLPAVSQKKGNETENLYKSTSQDHADA